MLKVFVGVDKRQPIAFQVLAHSIYTRCSVPVSITPLKIDTLPIKRIGLTEFTFSRYLVPWLCDYQGTGIFLDADMLVLGDLFDLYKEASFSADVSVVKNRAKFEWASMMVFNNARCERLTPEYIQDPKNKIYNFNWANSVGEISKDWNHCIGYDEPNPNAKLVHFTQGIPCFPETEKCEFSFEWRKEYKMANSTVPWIDIMGNSVHAVKMGLA